MVKIHPRWTITWWSPTLIQHPLSEACCTTHIPHDQFRKFKVKPCHHQDVHDLAQAAHLPFTPLTLQDQQFLAHSCWSCHWCSTGWEPHSHYKGRGGSLGSHDPTDDQPVQGYFTQQSHCSFGASNQKQGGRLGGIRRHQSSVVIVAIGSHQIWHKILRDGFTDFILSTN